jgi:hypothetical protein
LTGSNSNPKEALTAMPDTLRVPPSRFQPASRGVNLPSRQIYFMKKPSTVSAEPAFGYKVGSFDKSTNTSTPVDQAVTGLGFTPKALILMCSQTTAEDTQTVNLVTAMGFSDGTTEKSVWTGSEDLQTTMDADRYPASSKILVLRDPTSATSGDLLAECDLKSFDTDGFTLTWTTNNATAYKIKYVAIGGNDITADVGSFISSTSSGVQNISTGLSNANFILMLGIFPTAAQEDTLLNNTLFSIGMAASSADEGMAAIRCQDGVVSSNTARYQRTDKVIGKLVTSSDTVDAEASFNGFTASGFDLDWTNPPTIAFLHYYLTIKGGNWEVGNGTTPTSATTKAYTTTFQPEGLMMLSYTSTAGTVVKTNTVPNIGASDGTNHALISAIEIDGQGTSDSASRSSSTDVIVGYSNTTTTNEEGTVDSFNATDFTLDFTSADATARQFIWMVCKGD